MTRLANIENAGYFPLPGPVTDLILTYIAAPHAGRILDPCAGEGTALVTMARALGLEPFGVELHEGRAQAAREAVHEMLVERDGDQKDDIPRILNDSYQSLITSRDGFNFLYLNPPYDSDDEDGRLEYQWLWRCRPWLQPGGLLVWVVPQHLLKFRKAVRYVLSHFAHVRVYRFPDGQYEQFRQIVLIGVRRKRATTPEAEAVDAFRAMAEGKEALPALAMATEPRYTLPPLLVNPSEFKFRSLFVDPAEALTEAAQYGACTTEDWRRHLDPRAAEAPLRPLTPLKIGHMNSVIAAGHLNNQILEDGDERLLIKGRSYKSTREESYEEPLPDGGTKVTNLETEVVVTDITTVDVQGDVQSYSGPALEQFLTRWIGRLTAIVARDYEPAYRFDMNGYGPLLSRLSKERPIPGMNGRTGLLPAQKHAAAAVLTRLQTERDALTVGEMGCGKSSLSIAVAAGRKAARTIVLCPPHLVDKWRREIQAVWPKAATIHLKTPGDVEEFFAQRRDGRPVVGVLKQTTARSASGWEHAYDYGGPAGHNYGTAGYSDVRRPWGSVVSAAKLPQAGDGWRLSERQTAFLQMQGLRCPVCGAQQLTNGRPLAAQELKSARRFCDNPRCGSPLFQFTRRRSGVSETRGQERGSFQLYAERERSLRGYLRQHGDIPERELNRWSGTAVRDTFGYARVPLAGYIKHRARGRLDLLIVDEVHQYKGIDSDQGYAMHHLAQAAEKVVGLTGTVYGGKASSIFHLLYRLSPEMTGAYTDSQATGRRRIRHRDWVSAYGILQRIETKKLDEDGRQTANSRSNIRYKELPGGSPALLPWLLNRSVFLSLGDMGFPLPDYSEIPVEVPMAPEQALLYETLKADLKAELVERLVRGDKSLLAGYLHALLFWPDSPRRAKVVRCPRTGRVVASVPGLPEEFRGPKEEAIIDLILEQKAQGRRVLLLCLQTDTLDIQPEWKSMLAEAGLKAAILRAAPNKREGWVEKQVAAGVDVIITHPKKVETGIDLLDFPTIVWMSPHYSVYTVLQASRRSWRIGQTKPVKVYYFVYSDTIQTDALYLVAAKVAAALRVNGDTVADDSLAELDEITGNDIVATLARIVTGETQLDAPSLQQAFAQANASIRQANMVIGEYEMVDDADEVTIEGDAPAEIVRSPEPAPRHASQQTLVFGAGSRPLRAGADEISDAGEAGKTRLPLQNGVAQSTEPNGKANGAAPPVRSHHPPQDKDEDGEAKAPPVPRPRFLLNQLRSG
jgi:hypothetical protein